MVSFSAIHASSAFFSDRETSTGNMLSAGAVDLKIANTSYYNGQASPNTSWVLKDLTNELFFNFTDIKPGDMGEDTIGIKVHDNDAWACAEVRITKNDDNGNTEPELAEGDDPDDPTDMFDGELAQNLYFVFWTDDGDNVLETGEQVITQGPASSVLSSVVWPLADSQINTVGEPNGQPLKGGKLYHIGKAWCFGTMTLAPLLQDGSGSSRTPIGPEGPGLSCDGSSQSNITQTDVIQGDISFYAVQARHNPNFVCGQQPTPTPTQTPSPTITTTPVVTPSPTPSPTPTPLVCAPAYASSVVSVSQGTKNDGSPITDPNRTDPSKILGPADNLFFSLGKNGTVTLAFSTPISNIFGYDFTIDFFEITNGRSGYPEERAMVEVSQDGITFLPVTTYASSLPTGVTNIDFSSTGLPAIQYVRLTDATNFSLHDPTADGYDVDAIRGNCKAL